MPRFAVPAVFSAMTVAGAALAFAGLRPAAQRAVAAPTVPATTVAASAPSPSAATWTAKGTLLEACTCAVPCSCNFGEGPSPHPYCHAVYGYKLDPGSAWGTTDLSGLVIGGADGPNGNLGFLDDRATPAQQAALRRLADKVFAQGGPAGGPRTWQTAKIMHSVNGNDLRLGLGTLGGFKARVIVGRDGKSPVVVENNTIWPIPRAIKGRAVPLEFRDARTGAIHGDGTNANYGAFSFSGALGRNEVVADAVAVPATARMGAASAAGQSCCAGAGAHK